MNAQFLLSKETKELLIQLEQQFGIPPAALPGILLETGKEKVRLFTGSLPPNEIIELSKSAKIELIGLYILRKEHDLRLSFDATHLLASQISKSIVDITQEQAQLWLRGHDLDIAAPKGTVALRYGSDFLGCGKSTGERIANHVPKERRLKK